MPGFLEESRVRREARNRTGGGALAPTGAVSSKPRWPCAPDSAPAPTAELRQAADRHRVAGNPFDAFLVNNESPYWHDSPAQLKIRFVVTVVRFRHVLIIESVANW